MPHSMAITMKVRWRNYSDVPADFGNLGNDHSELRRAAAMQSALSAKRDQYEKRLADRRVLEESRDARS